MKKPVLGLIVLLLAALASGCNKIYDVKLIAVTQENGEAILTDNPSRIASDSDVRLRLYPIVNDKPGEITASEITIDYKVGATTIETVTVGDGKAASDKSAAKTLITDGNGTGVEVLIPFPLTADSAFITIKGLCDNKWLERVVVVTKITPPLSVEINAEGSENGMLVVTSGSTVVLSSTIKGGKPPYQYLWINPDGKVVGSRESLSIPNFDCTKNGSYQLKVIDSDGDTGSS